MSETLLSWAIARNAAVMSDQQLSDFIFESTKIRIKSQLIRKWRRGDDFPQGRIVQDSLAYTFGYDRYSRLLIPNDRVAMGVMIVGEQVGLSAERLRVIRLKKSVKHQLAEHMRSAIEITSDEVSAIGVAIEFWARYMTRPHPIVGIKMRFNNLFKGEENDGK